MVRRLVVLVGLLAACPAGLAGAQELDPSRFYLKGFGGANLARDSWNDYDSHGIPPLDPDHYRYDTGFVVGAAFGYRATERIGLEVEYAYRRTNARVDRRETVGGHVDRWSFDERVSVDSGMVNLLYEFAPPGPGSAVRPHLGAGIGVAAVDFGGERTDAAFAWQAIGGVSYALTPRWDLLGEVRWFSTEGGRYDEHELGLYSISNGFESVDLIVGATYRF